MSRLEELGGLAAARNARSRTLVMDIAKTSAWLDALVERIEELEAELSEANAHVNIHAALIDAQKIYSDGLRNRILQLEAENKKLRELKQMVLDHNGRISKMEIDPYSKDSERVRWDIVAKARECKALEGGPVSSDSGSLTDLIDSVLAHYEGPQVEAIKRDLIAAVESLCVKSN